MGQLGAVPFKNCPASSNPFIRDGEQLRLAGKYTVSWAFNFTPNEDAWRQTVSSFLAAYAAGVGNWETVETAIVEGWGYEYGVVNGK